MRGAIVYAWRRSNLFFKNEIASSLTCQMRVPRNDNGDMKIKTFLICLFLTANIALAATDKIIAIVNKDIITQSEADASLSFSVLQLAQEYQGQELEERVRYEKANLIARIIEDKLILQEAYTQGIRPKPEYLKKRIEQIKKEIPQGVSFEGILKERGLTVNDYEKHIGEQLIMREVIDRNIRNKVLVSPEEVTAYFNAHKEDFMENETRVVDLFLLDSDIEADGLIEDLKKGKSPEESAKEHNAQYSKEYMAFSQFRPEIRDVVFALGKQEISKPLNIDDKFYVFRLLQIISAKLTDLSVAHDKISSYLFLDKFNRKMTEWLDELKSKAFIEIKK